jgi:hypothetical protein
MDHHVCSYQLKSNDFFVCSEENCQNTHQCGADECEYLFYNRDQTQVCGITGLCFNQRVCETFVDSHRGIQGDDPIYIKRLKRDQQIKNRSLEYGYTMKLLKSISNIVSLDDKEIASLCSQILSLWQFFVMCTKEKNNYTHRKDKRCFVIAIAMSLNTGICSNLGQYIVHKHPTIHVNKLNKKSKYDTFKVSDIRGGTNLIINVFKNVTIDTSKTIAIHM